MRVIPGLLLLAMACRGSEAPVAGPVDAFWSDLERLCGNAYGGRLVEAPPGDTTFAGKALVMQVRSCGPDEIRIPFHVGDDRSRTWVLTRVGEGLRLKHDHRHEDGSEDAVTQYGGDARVPGQATQFDFPADSATIALLPAAATNVWTVAVEPGSRFVYALVRVGTDRRFRIEFDLGSQVDAPPAPWGE